MKDYKKAKLMRNMIAAALILIVFISAALGSIMKQYGVGLGKAWEQLNQDWSNKGKELVLDEPTLAASEEVTEFFNGVLAQGNRYVGERDESYIITYPEAVYTFFAGKGQIKIQIYEEGQLLEEWTLEEDPESGFESMREGVALKNGQIIVVTGGGIGSVLSEERLTVVKEIVPDHAGDFPVMLEEGDYEIGKDLAAGIGSFSLAGEDEASLQISEPGKGGMDVVLVPDDEFHRLSQYSSVLLREGDVLSVRGGSVQVGISYEK